MPSKYSKAITKFRIRQAMTRKLFTGHELLRCDIKPDVRPFKWPRRRKPPTLQQLSQPSLFENEQIMMPRGTCDECGKTVIEYNYTSSVLWNQAAQHRERICSPCFADLHMKLKTTTKGWW